MRQHGFVSLRHGGCGAAEAANATGRMRENMDLLVTGIESAYGRKKVLQGVSLAAETGQCVGLVGANGCGKSTLLGILAGLRRPDAGSILFDGKSAAEKDLIRCTGYVPQESNLIGELSVRDNLLLWYGGRAALEEAFRQEFLHRLGVEQLCRVRVDRLSGGMKKKVSIVCALAGNPPILLLDEPGAALDLPGKNEFRNFLCWHKSRGGTVLLATHDESELSVCDRIFVLHNGTSREIDRTLRGDDLTQIIQTPHSGRM